MNESVPNELIDQYYRSHYKTLHTFAMVQVKNKDVADDLVQNTFLLAIENYNKFSASPNKVGWLINALKFVLKKYYEDWVQTTSLLNKVGALNLSKSDSKPDEYNIRTALKGIINDDSLELLIRIYCEKDSYAEAAKDFGISLSACKSRVKVAKEKLREYYRKSS